MVSESWWGLRSPHRYSSAAISGLKASTLDWSFGIKGDQFAGALSRAGANRDCARAGNTAHRVRGRQGLVAERDQSHSGGEDVNSAIRGLERVIGRQNHARIGIIGYPSNCASIVCVHVAISIQGRDHYVERRA